MRMFSGKKKEHDECILHFEIAQRFDGQDTFNDIKAGRLADWHYISRLTIQCIFPMGSVLGVLVSWKTEGFAVHKLPVAKGRLKPSHMSP